MMMNDENIRVCVKYTYAVISLVQHGERLW